MTAAIGAVLLCSPAWAEESSLGVFRDGQRIGTSTFESTDVVFEGKHATKSFSKTSMNLALLGQDLTITIESTTWLDRRGKPILMRFKQDSGGKWQRMEARFGAKGVEVDINEQGRRTHQRLKLPKGPVIDDPIALVVGGGSKHGGTKSFYVLDPTTYAFMPNTVKALGHKSITIDGKAIDVTDIEIKDVNRTLVTHAYLSAKGDAVRIDGPLGLVMLPDPPSGRHVASHRQPVEGGTPEVKRPAVDLAAITKITPTTRLDEPTRLSRLKIQITGPDLSRAPSDEHQTVTKEGSHWTIDVHPVRYGSGKSFSILNAQNSMEQWIAPSLHMPSDDKKFRSLARQIVGARTTVKTAAGQIRRYVFEIMKPNAGMGILRSAYDVLDSKDGVCRDYAILTTTLMRAAGIPARLASGLVSLDGDFYYHAWTEVWDGNQWIGVDSTTDADQISAAHVKLADGNVDTAFAFTLLEKVKLDVLEAHKK